jgi:hypothetical protein
MTTDDYLVLVGYEFRDLPWKTKCDLLAEIRAHLSELPDEIDLIERLGRPEQYAADMGAAAGLERRRGLIAFLRARRLRNLILIAVVLTVAGLAIGAVVWINSYEPIAFAGAAQLPLDSKPSPGQAGVTVEFRKGRPFLYGIVIRNSGRFTVRVLGVPKSVTDFYSGRVLMSKDQSPRMDERPLKRFHPFDMKPGSFRWLVLEGPYACTTGMGGPPGPGYTTVTWGPSRFALASYGEPRRPRSRSTIH